MNPQDMQELLQENIHLARENNELLHSIRRSQMVSFWSKVVFYVIVVGVPVLVYQYYLQDYIQQMRTNYTTMLDTVEKVRALPSVENLPAAVLHRFQSEQGIIE
jgi:hypothetical protein